MHANEGGRGMDRAMFGLGVSEKIGIMWSFEL